jgi:HAD superfamily hydrolase (TIGR01509 family)
MHRKTTTTALETAFARAKLIIFDCDGVVVDSENIFKASQKEVLEQQSIRITEKWLTQNTHGFQLTDMLGAVEAVCGSQIDRAAFYKLYSEILTRRFTNCLKQVEGVSETCASLLKINKQICVATNGEADVTDLKLRSTGMDSYFSPEVRFFAAQVGLPKPAPDIFIFAADNMKHKREDCVVIEDSPFGIKAAKAAGMYAVGFLGGSHTAISGKHDYARKLREAGADIIVDNYSRLIKAAL